MGNQKISGFQPNFAGNLRWSGKCIHIGTHDVDSHWGLATMAPLANGLFFNPGNRRAGYGLVRRSLKNEKLGTPRGCAREVSAVTGIGESG